MSLADRFAPQGPAAVPSAAVDQLSEGVVLSASPAGLMVELVDQPGVSYGPLRWSPPHHVHTTPTLTSAESSSDPTGRECLVAFVDGDPGRGWVLQVAW